MRANIFSMEDIVDEAVTAVQNKESTDPKAILQVANYQEELAALKKANGEAGLGGGEDPAATEAPADPEGGEDPSGEDGGDAGGDEGENNGLGETEPSMEQLMIANEAINVAFSLGRIADKLRTANKVGGASPQAARIAYECANALAGSIGFTGPRATYSAEAFESYSTRISATTVAIEGISDVAKDIWNAIKQFFRSIWNWMKEYLFGIKQEIRAQEDQYREINEAFDELRGKLKDKDAELVELKAKKVREKRYRARAQNLLTANSGNSEDVIIAVEAYNEFLLGYGDMIESLLKSKIAPVIYELIKPDPDVNLTKMRVSESDFGGLRLSPSRDSNTRAAVRTGMVNLVSDVLPGNKMLSVITPRDGDRKAIDELTVETQVNWIDLNQGRGRGAVEVECEFELEVLEKIQFGNKALDKTISNLSRFMDDKYKLMKQKTESFLAADMRSWVNLDEDKVKELQGITNELLRLQMSMVERSTAGVLKSALAFSGASKEYISFCVRQTVKELQVTQGTQQP